MQPLELSQIQWYRWIPRPSISLYAPNSHHWRRYTTPSWYKIAFRYITQVFLTYLPNQASYCKSNGTITFPHLYLGSTAYSHDSRTLLALYRLPFTSAKFSVFAPTPSDHGYHQIQRRIHVPHTRISQEGPLTHCCCSPLALESEIYVNIVYTNKIAPTTSAKRPNPNLTPDSIPWTLFTLGQHTPISLGRFPDSGKRRSYITIYFVYWTTKSHTAPQPDVLAQI